MPRLQVHFDNLAPTQARLREIDDRLSKPIRPLLEARGQSMTLSFRENILTEGARLADRGIQWPQLHPATRAIRRHYGHGEARLVRGGELLHSIAVLELGDDYVDVGTALFFAKAGVSPAILQDGGNITDARGVTRTVQAFPFILPSAEDIEDHLDAIDFFFFGDSEGGGDA